LYSKNELINWYDENIVKTKTINIIKECIKRKIKQNTVAPTVIFNDSHLLDS
jgi:hypothetical protein